MVTLNTKAGALERICERFAVERLDLFGSAATSQFDAARSDLDFLVKFRPGTDLGPWLSRYFALREELAKLYGRKVDLVMRSAIRDRWFAREAAKTCSPVYDGSKNTKVAS